MPWGHVKRQSRFTCQVPPPDSPFQSSFHHDSGFEGSRPRYSCEWIQLRAAGSAIAPCAAAWGRAASAATVTASPAAHRLTATVGSLGGVMDSILHNNATWALGRCFRGQLLSLGGMPKHATPAWQGALLLPKQVRVPSDLHF